MMSKKKLIVGMTASVSIALIPGQLKYFEALGYETYLLIPNSKEVEEFCKKESCRHLPIIIERDISLWKDVKSLFAIVKIIRTVKPDIINFSTAKMGFLGLIAARLCRVNYRIFTCRGFRHEHENWYMSWLLRFTDYISGLCAHKIICISRYVMETGVNEHIFPENKCTVINKGSSNGIDLTLFSTEHIDNIRREILYTNFKLQGYFVFGFVGRMNDRKGINELFEAFSTLYKTNERIKLLMVGPIEIGRFNDKTLIERMKYHPGILFVGHQKQMDIPIFLTLMDVLVLPTWSEGFGNVLIQAAAMGLPTIGTSNTGAQDALSDGYNGILVPVKDCKLLYNAMSFLFKNPEVRSKYAVNSICWAKNFDQKIIWDGINDVYKIKDNEMVHKKD